MRSREFLEGGGAGGEMLGPDDLILKSSPEQGHAYTDDAPELPPAIIRS